MVDENISTEQNLEQRLSELEQIVSLLEGGSISINEAIAKYSEGMRLALDCQRDLNTLSNKVKTAREDAMREFNRLKDGDNQTEWHNAPAAPAPMQQQGQINGAPAMVMPHGRTPILPPAPAGHMNAPAPGFNNSQAPHNNAPWAQGQQPYQPQPQPFQMQAPQGTPEQPESNNNNNMGSNQSADKNDDIPF